MKLHLDPSKQASMLRVVDEAADATGYNNNNQDFEDRIVPFHRFVSFEVTQEKTPLPQASLRIDRGAEGQEYQNDKPYDFQGRGFFNGSLARPFARVSPLVWCVSRLFTEGTRLMFTLRLLCQRTDSKFSYGSSQLKMRISKRSSEQVLFHTERKDLILCRWSLKRTAKDCCFHQVPS
jgi:hypothetical protein